MPLSLSAAARLEKNKLASTKPWILLIEMQVNDEITLHLCMNNENITWNGIEWIAFPIKFSDKTYDMKSIPSFDVQVSNVNQVVQGYLEEYKGLVDCPTIFRLVHAAHLNQTAPEMEEEFEVQKTTYNDEWVTFKFGSNFYLFFRALSERYLRDYCTLKYGKIECGVSASCLSTYPDCPHILTGCRVRMAASNITKIRFGGCPGMGGMFASNT